MTFKPINQDVDNTSIITSSSGLAQTGVNPLPDSKKVIDYTQTSDLSGSYNYNVGYFDTEYSSNKQYVVKFENFNSSQPLKFVQLFPSSQEQTATIIDGPGTDSIEFNGDALNDYFVGHHWEFHFNDGLALMKGIGTGSPELQIQSNSNFTVSSPWTIKVWEIDFVEF